MTRFNRNACQDYTHIGKAIQKKQKQNKKELLISVLLFVIIFTAVCVIGTLEYPQ